MNIKDIPDINHCVEVGMISRPHGKEGEVLVSIKDIDASDFKDLEYVYFCLQERLVPFFIESVTLKNNSVFVKFEDIKTMEKAEHYCSTKIYLEQDDDYESEDLDVDLVGFSVIDSSTKQKVGDIQEVLAYSMNVVLDVKKTDGSSVLVPFADELLEQCDESAKTLVLRIPDGILE